MNLERLECDLGTHWTQKQGDLDEFPGPNFGHHCIYIYIYIIYSTYWFPKFGLPVGATEIHPTWHQKLHLDDVDG